MPWYIGVRPPDVPDNTVPLIVQFAPDIPVGAPFVLVMVDFITHGQRQEAHFRTVPRVRRRILAIPDWISRQVFLMQTQIFNYCQFVQFRCLLNHNFATWPLQEVGPRQFRHGDYVQVIIPPPQRCEVSTRILLEASQRMAADDFWNRYSVPSSPSSVSAASSTDVSPSLVDSEEIRREFGPQDSVPDDEAGFMQLGTSSSSSDVPNTTAAQQIAQIVNDSCILAFDPNAMHRQPRWMRALSASFAAEAQVEHVDEGPVAYVTTWYIDCAFSSTNEDSRVVRIDFLANLWAQDFQHAWRDKLQPGKAVHLAWVNPRPRDNQFARTIGHVIVFQNPNEMFAPILIHFQFQALNLEGISHAVASISHGIAPDDFASVVQLDRVCRGRRCTLHRGTPGKLWQDPFDAGECIKFVIPPPGSPSDFALHWGLGSVVPVFENVVEPLPPATCDFISHSGPFCFCPIPSRLVGSTCI